MGAVNARLFDFQVARQLDLLALARRQADDLATILRQSDASVEDVLVRGLRGQRTQARNAALRDQLRKVVMGAHARIRGETNAFVRRLARDETAAQTAAFARVLQPYDVSVATPSAREVLARVRRVPMVGAPLRDWVRRLAVRDFERTWDAVRRSEAMGLSTDATIQAVIGTRRLGFGDGARATSRRGAQTLARTATTHIAAQARTAMWLANERLVGAEQWAATLDLKVTATCGSLGGRAFPLDDGPRPPAHFGCRSTTTPVVRRWRALGLSGLGRAARAALDGQPAERVEFEVWLRRRSAAAQDTLLGPSRGRLFRRGALSLRMMLAADLQPLTLDQLERRVPTLFERLGL